MSTDSPTPTDSHSISNNHKNNNNNNHHTTRPLPRRLSQSFLSRLGHSLVRHASHDPEQVIVKDAPTWHDTSDHLWLTGLRKDVEPRAYYFKHAHHAPEPVLGVSSFIPRRLVTHLMRMKKDSALGIKYKPGDQITNMEGAFHQLVTPFAPILMHGDYRFHHHHTVELFPLGDHSCQQARVVLLSGLVQPDFETTEVTLQMVKLEPTTLHGTPFDESFSILDARCKRDPELRASYDHSLKLHAIHHLTQDHQLPGFDQIHESHVYTMEQAITKLDQLIMDLGHAQACHYTFICLPPGSPPSYLSLEMLLSIATHQMSNEFRVLETLMSSNPDTSAAATAAGQSPRTHHGYIYTWDPASIFAAHLDATLLNRLAIFGIKQVLDPTSPLHVSLAHMRAFGFNDYQDKDAIRLLTHVFAHHPETAHVKVVSKSDLFSPPSHAQNGHDGKYYYHPGAILTKGDNPNNSSSNKAAVDKTILVLHNNSDAFGQNIETEGPNGSLDGAIGTWSSAAASLRRDRDWNAIRVI